MSRPASTPVTGHHAYYLLTNVLKHAVQYGYIPVSPCQDMGKNRGKDNSTTRPTHTVEEFEAVLRQLPLDLK